MTTVANLTASVQGVEKVALAFGTTMPANIRAELRRAVDRLALELQAKVKRDWLTGPRPQRLGVLSGTLRRSINLARIDTPTEVKAQVGTNVIYGHAWELGNVKNWQKQVQPARPFLRPAYEELRSHIQATLQTAVTKAVAKGGTH